MTEKRPEGRSGRFFSACGRKHTCNNPPIHGVTLEHRPGARRESRQTEDKRKSRNPEGTKSRRRPNVVLLAFAISNFRAFVTPETRKGNPRQSSRRSDHENTRRKTTKWQIRQKAQRKSATIPTAAGGRKKKRSQKAPKTSDWISREAPRKSSP